MQVKKSSRANLDKNSTNNFLMGLVIALGFLFIGFEYSNTEVTVQDIYTSSGEIEEEIMIEITRQYIPPPPPPPQTVQTDLIQIVEDNTLEEEVEFATMEDIPDEAVVMTYSSGDISEEYDPDGEVFMFVEEMPGFPGGESALMKFINDNLRYPQLALENGISGRVICTFVIDGRGKVSDIQVIRSVDPNLDREAIRVISMMPDWKPGKQRGKPVRVRYTLPIIFKLQ